MDLLRSKLNHCAGVLAAMSALAAAPWRSPVSEESSRTLSMLLNSQSGASLPGAQTAMMVRYLRDTHSVGLRWGAEVSDRAQLLTRARA